MKQIFVCAGEASGDLHASALIHALQSRRPDLEFFGLGGELMAAVGVELLYNLHDLAVTGFWEVAKRFGHFRKVYRRTLREIDARRPDLILLVDYPGFNLRLATNLKRQGYKIAYFILPQVWAWKPARIRRLEENADLLLAILPFEPPLFDPSMVRCEFVGHPLLDLINSNSGDNAFKRKNSIAENQRIIALLPGSREVEINRHYLVMLEVIKAISAEFADIVPVTLVRNEIDTVLYRAIEQKSGVTSHHCQRDRYGLLRAAECSLVASG
ncbi:MAG: lipid-A-disaccharide synthase, partial [candidate division Zixibacteria bacterium]|nr:lipid-A-disaccharide synthase [candidate division Zixibacteria bacterium]